MTTHTRTRLALPMAIALCAAAPAAAQQASDVHGVVVDARTGAPVADARVSAGPRHTGTDPAGRFRLCGVPDAARLTVEAMRYHPDSSVTASPAGGSAAVRVALQPDTTTRTVSLYLRRPYGGASGRPLPLYVMDGERVFLFVSGCETPPPGIRAIDVFSPDVIESIHVLRGEEAVARYGPEGEHGVVLITTTTRGAGTP